MIYRLTFSCEEGDPNFRRVFEADADATFQDLHEAILKSVGYPNDQMTSFFMCNDEWEKGQEVTLVPMDSNFEYDNMVMNETRVSGSFISSIRCSSVISSAASRRSRPDR